MRNKIVNYKYEELFTSAIDKEASYPYNIKFERKPRDKKISGPGIYLITYKEQVLYVGSHCKHNDIISDRWLRHINTITNRGSKVGFGRNSKQKFKNEIEPLFNKFNLNFNQKEISKNRLRDTGYVTSIKRLEFILKNKLFLKENEDFSEMEFHLLVLVGKPEKAIKGIEKDLICKINPPCNKQYDKHKATGSASKSNAMKLLKLIV
jgi:hypothetical protein